MSATIGTKVFVAEPSADVGARVSRVSSLLGAMSVPLTESDVPDALIRTIDTPRLEVMKTETGEKRPVLDAATFEVLSKLILSQTKKLRTELPPRMEFLGITAEAAPTLAGRWYIRLEDTRGQKMDVVFGTGTFPQAQVLIHDHMGRSSVEETLSDEATRELATLLVGASLTPLRADPDAEEADDIGDEDDDEEVKAEEAETARKIVELRERYFAEAKAQLKNIIERAPLKMPPLMRELERKKADDLTEADVERMVSTIAGQPITLKAFVLENVDGNSMRMSVPGASDDGSDFVELVVDREEDEPVVWLRVCIRPAPPADGDVTTPLESDQQLTDEVDDEVLTPFIEVTHSPLGEAVLRFASRTLDPPIEIDPESELAKMVAPEEPKPEEPAKRRTGAWGRASPKVLRDAAQFQAAIDALKEAVDALKEGAVPTSVQKRNLLGRIAAVRVSPPIAGHVALKNKAMVAANQVERKLGLRAPATAAETTAPKTRTPPRKTTTPPRKTTTPPARKTTPPRKTTPAKTPVKTTPPRRRA